MLTREEAIQIIVEAGYTQVQRATDLVYERGNRTVGVGEDGLTVYQVPSPLTSRYLKAGGRTLVYRKTDPDELRLYLDSRTILIVPVGAPDRMA